MAASSLSLNIASRLQRERVSSEDGSRYYWDEDKGQTIKCGAFLRQFSVFSVFKAPLIAHLHQNHPGDLENINTPRLGLNLRTGTENLHRNKLTE